MSPFKSCVEFPSGETKVTIDCNAAKKSFNYNVDKITFIEKVKRRLIVFKGHVTNITEGTISRVAPNKVSDSVIKTKCIVV